MRALVSVSDKTGLVEFVSGLQSLGWEIIATGGTQSLLEKNGVKTIGISDVTGFPEICDGRVKTYTQKFTVACWLAATWRATWRRCVRMVSSLSIWSA